MSVSKEDREALNFGILDLISGAAIFGSIANAGAAFRENHYSGSQVGFGAWGRADECMKLRPLLVRPGQVVFSTRDVRAEHALVVDN